ncbi:protein of unknown function [Candidatus Nitrotoga arctica]|uniref:Transposase DDE domain-containing protein n=1 Tax=Candidatus Nitrotoga arctica TaxID=453162 RepID=A0ABM8YX30_9PROT|nr:protein of unknown function [Candidatus Nitrotoga arctica]
MITDAGFRGAWFRLVNRMGWYWIGRIRNCDMVSPADVDTIDPARFINEFLLVFDVYGVWKKKMPASSREKYCMNDASKSFVCTAKVWR